MEPVTSVTAFVARYVDEQTTDAEAASALAELDEEERLVLRSQTRPPGERLSWLSAQGARVWSVDRLRHAEERAMVDLRRVLQERGWWRD